MEEDGAEEGGVVDHQDDDVITSRHTHTITIIADHNFLAMHIVIEITNSHKLFTQYTLHGVINCLIRVGVIK